MKTLFHSKFTLVLLTQIICFYKKNFRRKKNEWVGDRLLIISQEGCSEPTGKSLAC
jgi:hypothetical protein